VQNRELGENELEPPVPAGLGKLTGAQRALTDFLRLDPDLLAAAARASKPPNTDMASSAALRRWVKRLPEAEKDEMLLRVLQGDGGLLRSEMLRRFDGAGADRPADGERTVGELLAACEEAWARKQAIARQRETAERRRREQTAADAWEKRLDSLARNPTTAWQQVTTLIDVTRAREYDIAVTLLQDLQALARRNDEVEDFAARMGTLRERYGRRPALIDRLDRAELP